MKENDPLLVDTGRGFSIFYKNRYLYSQSKPRETAERKFLYINPKPQTIVFIPSPLLFYGIDLLLKKLPDSSIIITFELDPKLHNLAYNSNMQPQDERLYIVYNDSAKISKLLDKIGLWKFRRVEMYTVTGGYTLDRKKYDNLLSSLTRTVQEYWQNRMTAIYMGPLWIKNVFYNIKTLSKTKESSIIWDFSKTIEHKPVLVTGAGESLENSIDDIKNNRKDIIILAVDTSLSVLLLNKIKPDYIISLDSQIYNYFDFFGLKDSTIPLIFDLTTFPCIPRNFKGKFIPFVSEFSRNRLLSRLINKFNVLTIFPSLGSVGIAAVYSALKLTKGPVIYTGIDFSFKIGKSHAKGSPAILFEHLTSTRTSPAGKVDPFFARPLKTLKGKKNLEIITNGILHTYSSVMRNYFSSSSRIFDLGEYGTPSAGIPVNSIKEAFTKYKEYIPDNNSIIEELKEPSNSQSTLETDISGESLINFLEEEMTILENVYSSIVSWLNGQPCKSQDEEKKLLEKIKNIDYVYLHFPDPDPNPSINRDYLKRLLVSAKHYGDIIKNILITL